MPVLKKSELERIEKKLGMTTKEIREISPERLREKLATKANKAIAIISRFPLIGRGNVLRDKLVSRESIESSLDKIFAGDISA